MTLSSDNDDLLHLTAHRDAERRMRDLANLAMRLSAAATRDDVCDVSLDRGMATLGAYAGGVLMLNAQGTCLELCASRGFPAEQLESYQRVTLDRSLPSTDAVRLAQPVYLSTREAWIARYGEPPIVSSGTQSAAALPLIVDNRVTGVLTLSFDRPRELDVSDRVFMEALAHECALALERAALYDRERKARAEAEEANRAKGEFLATLSHELRTPLNAILGWAQVLKTHVSDERGVRGLDTIVRNALAQARLIDEMLDVSRIITGKLQLDPQEVEAPPNLLPVTRTINDQHPLAGLSIVLVEDAEDSRQLATWLLEEAGAEVRGAGTAEEGMRMIEARRPDVLIADIGLPGEDGYSLIRRLRELEIRHDLPRLPAAALTAYATAEDRKRALLAGFSMHLPKPVDSEELTAVVMSLTGRNVPDPT